MIRPFLITTALLASIVCASAQTVGYDTLVSRCEKHYRPDPSDCKLSVLIFSGLAATNSQKAAQKAAEIETRYPKVLTQD